MSPIGGLIFILLFNWFGTWAEKMEAIFKSLKDVNRRHSGGSSCLLTAAIVFLLAVAMVM